MIAITAPPLPPLAAWKKPPPASLKKLTSSPKKRVWNFFNIPSGRSGKKASIDVATATGSVQYSYKTASGQEQHTEYDPFGNVVAQSGTLQQPYQWSSKENDGNGLVYYLYRFYNPSLGRWQNRDPIGIKGGINNYGYILNQPSNKVDLLGLRSWWQFLTGCPDCSSWDEKAGSTTIAGKWQTNGFRFDYGPNAPAGQGAQIANTVYGEYKASAKVTCVCKDNGKEKQASGTRSEEKDLNPGALLIRTSSNPMPLEAPSPASAEAALGESMSAGWNFFGLWPSFNFPSPDDQKHLNDLLKGAIPSDDDLGNDWVGGKSPCAQK